MTNAEKMQMLQTVFTKIFLSKLKGTDITKEVIKTNTGTFTGRWFNNSTTQQATLRGFDFTCNVGDRVVSLRCLEQNPDKLDNFNNLKKFANLARQGQQIMWIIDRNVKQNGFLGRIHNGEYHPSFTPATSRVDMEQVTRAHETAQTATASQTEQLRVEDLPEIPNDIGVPDYVMQDIADMDEPPWEGY